LKRKSYDDDDDDDDTDSSDDSMNSASDNKARKVQRTHEEGVHLPTYEEPF
jgi:hypothetical protein